MSCIRTYIFTHGDNGIGWRNMQPQSFVYYFWQNFLWRLKGEECHPFALGNFHGLNGELKEQEIGQQLEAFLTHAGSRQKGAPVTFDQLHGIQDFEIHEWFGLGKGTGHLWYWSHDQRTTSK